MTELKDQALGLLSEDSWTDTLTVSRAIFGRVALASQINPTLYSLLKDKKVEQKPNAPKSGWLWRKVAASHEGKQAKKEDQKKMPQEYLADVLELFRSKFGINEACAGVLIETAVAWSESSAIKGAAVEARSKLFCDLCNISASSTRNMTDHLRGYAHNTRLRNKLREESKSENPLETLHCRLCDIKTTSADGMRDHLSGKAHLKRCVRES